MQIQDTLIGRKLQDGRLRIYLKLPNESRERFIGEIDNRVLTAWRQPSKHRYRTTNSLAFNYKLFRDYGHLFDTIAIQYGERYLYTDREFFEAHAGFKHHKKSGYEKQLFMSLERFDSIVDMPKAALWKTQFNEVETKRKSKDNLQLGLSFS